MRAPCLPRGGIASGRFLVTEVCCVSSTNPMRRSDYCGPFTIERGGMRLTAVLTIRPWWDVEYAGRAAQINGVRRFVAARRFSRCCEFGSVKPGIAQSADDVARQDRLSPHLNPISHPIPPRPFDLAVCETGHCDDNREEHRESEIAPESVPSETAPSGSSSASHRISATPDRCRNVQANRVNLEPVAK